MSLEEALAHLVQAGRQARIMATEPVATAAALGRVLAQPVVSSIDVPPAANTSMDGYALRAADVPSLGAVLPVAMRIPAGHVGTALAPGQAARIFTGGHLPAGADAVVMQEQCEALPGPGLGSVRVNTAVVPGQWVRRQGEDVAAGATVLAAGSRITPQAMGLAATVGAAQLQVLRRPRVALFSTGDELVMPGEPLPPGAIYNSNRYTLLGLLQAAGCEVQDLGVVPDRLSATQTALREAAGGADLILTSGGVSVGEEDHLRPAVLSLGELHLWQVAIKPGKPLALGAVRHGDAQPGRSGSALFVGLPGNPVSSCVTFLVAVMPLLRALQGLPTEGPRAMPVPAAFDWPRPDRRREFLRVRLNHAGAAELFANQSSGVLSSVVWADGLVDNPPGRTITAGDTVAYLPLASLLC
jgi:molybdopterin molybdotransferase